MQMQTLETSPRNHRGGQVSHLLLAPGQFGSQNLAITWVEGGPGTPVLVPPDTAHSIRNVGEEKLVFISATSPPFAMPPAGGPFAYSPAP